MQKEFFGNCAICGDFTKLSFEHIPPKKAFNHTPILVQSLESMTNENHPFYKRKRKLNQGFGAYTLCISCNNNTGHWYARDYIDFVYQAGFTLYANKGESWIKGVYRIKPLNVVKQIVSMFMSINQDHKLYKDEKLKEFILNKQKRPLPEQYRIYMFSTWSELKRRNGFAVVVHPQLGIQKWSELSFIPLGFLLTDRSKPAHPDMLDITKFSEFSYNFEIDLPIKTRNLKIIDAIPGKYVEV